MPVGNNSLRQARCMLAVVTLVGLVAAPSSATARPSVFTPAFAVSHAGSTFLTLSLTGTGFGRPGGGSFVRVVGVAGGTIVSLPLPSTDPNVVIWSDEHVVVNVRQDLSAARIGVETPSGTSSQVRADHYDFEAFDTSAALGIHTGPNHLALDAQGRVWINGEFHSGIAYFDPVANAVKPAFWPRVPVPVFRSLIGGGNTTASDCGEDAASDSKGRVWIPEGGSSGLGPRNHSRIVGYDPTDGKVIVFNLPGDQNGINGVAWDQARNRLWFTQMALPGVHPGTLTSFDPDNPAIPREEYAWDFATVAECTGGVCSDDAGRSCSRFGDCMIGTFDFTTSATCDDGTCSNAPYHQCQTVEDCVYADKICPPGVVDDSGCYHDYPLPPGNLQPAHLVVHPRDGSVWWANYFLGSSLGRLDPATGQVTSFPLAPVPFSPAQVAVDSLEETFATLLRLVDAPWDIDVASNGDIVATEFSSNRIARLRGSRVGDPGCERLAPPRGSSVSCASSAQATFPQTLQLADPSCVNPCITESLVPDTWVPDATAPPFTHRPVTSLLGLASDRSKNLWFGGGVFVKGGKHFALLPPLLALYPSSFSPGDLHEGVGGGMAINQATGEIWAADPAGLRLNRLVKMTP